MASVTIKLDGRFQKQLKARIGSYTADVGILKDATHYAPLTMKQVMGRVEKHQSKTSILATRTAFLRSRFKTYAGGLARKFGKKEDGLISEASERLRASTGINFYTAPFNRLGKNADIVKFANGFVQLLIKGTVTKKRVENLLQAVVRNPILRGDYGRNSPATAKAKGFNRFMIDTAQLFQAITAKVTGPKNSGGPKNV